MELWIAMRQLIRRRHLHRHLLWQHADNICIVMSCCIFDDDFYVKNTFGSDAGWSSK